MARRQFSCSKWTLVLLVVLVLPYVFSRPQDNITGSSTSASNEKTTETNRYNLGNNVDTQFDTTKVFRSRRLRNNNVLILSNFTHNSNQHKSRKFLPVQHFNKSSSFYDNKQIIGHNKLKLEVKEQLETTKYAISQKTKPKPSIRKVLTKWTDNAKIEGLSIKKIPTSDDHELQFSTNDKDTNKGNEFYQIPYFQNNKSKLKLNYPNKLRPQQNHKHAPTHTNYVHILDNYNRPEYIYTTPFPTPIITHWGEPKPWHQNHASSQHLTGNFKPTPETEPVQFNNNLNYGHNTYSNGYPNYNNDNDITTFTPINAYTERIVIKPEEYNAPSDDCPTIYLTLNNSFQGQAKEACPDLNIAVNTNVMNKNVVVESDEEEVDELFPGAFGLPLTDDSPEDDPDTEYVESHELEDDNDEDESGSVENAELTNYNAPQLTSNIGSNSQGSSGLPGSPLAPLTKPSKTGNKDDDLFSVSSLIDFFKPAVSALTWIATINPFSFSLFSLLLAPIAVLLAGSSGLTAVFAPWALPFAREATEVVHVYRPQWHWDDEQKTWHLERLSGDKTWSRLPRNNKEIQDTPDTLRGKPTLFYKIKNVMTEFTKKINKILSIKINMENNKSSKGEAWQRRIKLSSEATEGRVEISSTENSVARRDVKTKSPIIGDSIKLVASQLLEKPNTTSTPVVADTRVPPKLKNQLSHKNKIKTRNSDENDKTEVSHQGEAVPITIEELESENTVADNLKESSTSKEGLSTWILLSNPPEKENISDSTEPTKPEEPQKKQKPYANKNKTKRPQTVNKPAKRPIIASVNKSDLIASGSAINDNVLNKIKDTVLSNVQKNKNSPNHKTTTSTTSSLVTESVTAKKEEATKSPATTSAPIVKVSSKTSKLKNKVKNKVTSTEATTINDSALLPVEAKEHEIELEISTPATTTKKPKRSSSKKKKNKNKKRKTTTSKTEKDTSVTTIKTPTKTKTSKPAKKPDNPITSQIYTYLSREVMPSVGVGMIGLAGLVGLASYFLYPFTTPVRRTLEVDKKDDLYRHNAEEYASEGNGQAEEEMLGTVLAGMPAHSKHKLNPYMGQMAHANRYSPKKDQDLKYRHVAAASGYDAPQYNSRYPQQKTGIAHGVVYPDSSGYQQKYETRHAYPTGTHYSFEKIGHTPYPAVEPISAPQTGPSAIGTFNNEGTNSVVYGVKPSSEIDFKPVYPFEGQVFSETTSIPTYPSTSLYLGSNNEQEPQEDTDFADNTSDDESDDKFVVGNVPKELVDNATPALVPEHGPRSLNRRKRSVVDALDEILKSTPNEYMSNEIDGGKVMPTKSLYDDTKTTSTINMGTSKTETDVKVSVIPFSSPSDMTKTESTNVPSDEYKTEIIESVSTQPHRFGFDETKIQTTEPNISNEVYETSPAQNFGKNEDSVTTKSMELTTENNNINTETTTSGKAETTSNMPSVYTSTEVKGPEESSPITLRPTNNPNVITYPPMNGEGGLLNFIKSLIQFKYRLGLSLLQTTSESLNRYLRNMENSAKKNTNTSKKFNM